MTKTIDMQLIRYINLFERISHVSTTNCFVYNNIIIFAVPGELVSRAIGKNGFNVKKISEALRRKVKVIQMVSDISELDKFVASVVDPVKFTKVEVEEGIVTITAGRQNKAALIGRNRIREQELEGILKKFFNVQKVKIA